MAVNEPGLFEMPDRQPAAASPGRLPRGRNRETRVRTVTAEVNIIDAEALRDAALRVEESGLTIALGAGLDVQDTVAEADVDTVGDTFEKLGSLIWPTDGLEEPLAAGAFRILSVDSAAVAESDDRGILTWTVMVKLTREGAAAARAPGAPRRGRVDLGEPGSTRPTRSCRSARFMASRGALGRLRSVMPRRARPGNPEPT